MSEMQIKLLQKVEELTLYVIEQEKRMEAQQATNQKQNEMIEELRNEVLRLKRNE